MTKVTKVEIVREYAEKNPTMTVRQMASDLDMAPAYVHQIMWNLRKKGKLPPSNRRPNKIEIPKEWEEDAQAMQMEVRQDRRKIKVNTKSNLVDRILMADAVRNGFGSAPVKNEGTSIAYDNGHNVDALKIAKLEMELDRAQIIIGYLEKRVEELSVRR